MSRKQSRRAGIAREVGITAALVAATFIAYSPVLTAGFINYDDDMHVYENPSVRAGLTWAGVRWAWTARFDQWHPLTWMSLQLDATLFGDHAPGYHLTSLVIHAGTVGLLFWLLRVMTGAVWRSALTAALFALHPLNVESVAWVSERKGILSAFFGMLALWAYLGYARRPTPGRYALVFVTYGLGLLSKAMLVTLPGVMLLLDYWPLRRVRGWAPGREDESPGVLPVSWARVLAEKIPFVAVAALFGVLTVFREGQAGALRSGSGLPLGARLANVVVAYVRYIGKAAWPAGLVPFYPHPGTAVATGAAVAAGLMLAGVTVAAVKAWRRRPYLPVGWLWFVGTLVPVIGFIPVGSHGMADRYAYWPLIGLFLLLSWGTAELVMGGRLSPAAAVTGAALALGLCAGFTHRQAGYWHDNVSLWEHTLRADPDNPVGHTKLGEYYLRRGKVREAGEQFVLAVKADPGSAIARQHLGETLIQLGDPEGAIRHLREADRILPGEVTTLYLLGLAYARADRPHEAVAWYTRALERNPDYALAHNNLGLVLQYQGERARALAHFEAAVRADPGYASAQRNLGLALLDEGRFDEAAVHLAAALAVRPDDPEVAAGLKAARNRRRPPRAP